MIGSETPMRKKLHSWTNGNSALSVNFDFNDDYLKFTKDEDISKKLCLSTCPSISPQHIALRYDLQRDLFELYALSAFSLNEKTLTSAQKWVEVKNLDKLQFYCSKCYVPHLYYFIRPNKERGGSQQKPV